MSDTKKLIAFLDEWIRMDEEILEQEFPYTFISKERRIATLTEIKGILEDVIKSREAIKEYCDKNGINFDNIMKRVS